MLGQEVTMMAAKKGSIFVNSESVSFEYSRRTIMGALGFLPLLPALAKSQSLYHDTCGGMFRPLSLNPNDWESRSLNPNDRQLLRQVDGAVETINGYGLSWYMKEEFRNAVLMIDWRTTQIQDNSGIFVRTPGNVQVVGGKNVLDTARDEGHEIQIDERGYDVGNQTAGHPKKKTGAIYDIQAPAVYASRAVGAWNTYLIGLHDAMIWVVLNGILVNSYESTRAPSGFLALQSFGPDSHVQFRNLYIMRLP
jgi:hypothetical protein